jgi:hypothetical protein
MTKAKQQVLGATKRESIDSAARGSRRVWAWTPKNQTMALACPAIRKKSFLSVTLLNRFPNDAA